MPQNRSCDVVSIPFDIQPFPLGIQPTNKDDKDQDIKILIDRVNHLIDLLEQKSSVIITGQRAIEEYEKINKTS